MTASDYMRGINPSYISAMAEKSILRVFRKRWRSYQWLLYLFSQRLIDGIERMLAMKRYILKKIIVKVILFLLGIVKILEVS